MNEKYISLFQLFTETDDYCLAKHYVSRAIPYIEESATLPLDDDCRYEFLVASLAALYYAIDVGKNANRAFQWYQEYAQLCKPITK